MAKQITRIAKLEFIGGQAKPGPNLASLGINMPQFCIKFNNETKERKGDVVPVVITAYKDKSFEFVIKTTPTAVLLKRILKLDKGSANAKTEIVGTITRKQVEEIAKHKMPDLNAYTLEAAVKTILGTARNMGIKLEEAVAKKENKEDVTKDE